MNAAFWAWFGIIIYTVLGTFIAFMARRRMGAGITEFFLANRAVGGFVSALTYSATTYSAFMMIGLAGLTYLNGVGALGYELTYLCGIFMMVFFLPRFWLAGKKWGYISPMELLTDRYQSKAVGAAAAILALIFLVPYAAAQFLGIGLLLNGISQGAIPVLAGIIIAVIINIIWSNIAGMRSVAWTDAFQALIMLVTSIIALGIVVSYLGGFGAFFSRLETETPGLLTVPAANGAWSINMFIGFALPWFFFLITNPQVSQRLFIPRSVRAMKIMVGGFFIFGFIYTMISILWGFSTVLLVPGLKVGDQATPTLLSQPFIPTGVAIVVMIGILGAAISTVDSIMLTLSSVWARDIYKAYINPRASEERELRVGQWVIPVMSIIAFVFAWFAWTQSSFNFLIAPLSAAASSGLLMVVPTIFGAFFWRRATAAGAISSIAAGAVVVLFFQVTNLKPLGWYPGTWGFVVCTVVFIVASLATRAPLTKADEFMGYLREKLKEGKFF